MDGKFYVVAHARKFLRGCLDLCFRKRLFKGGLFVAILDDSMSWHYIKSFWTILEGGFLSFVVLGCYFSAVADYRSLYRLVCFILYGCRESLFMFESSQFGAVKLQSFLIGQLVHTKLKRGIFSRCAPRHCFTEMRNEKNVKRYSELSQFVSSASSFTSWRTCNVIEHSAWLVGGQRETSCDITAWGSRFLESWNIHSREIHQT